LCPTETKTGFTPLRVLTTEPMISFLSLSGLVEPFGIAGILKSPMSLLFAQPIVGISKNSPK
jgi:hypothetical protein